MYLRKKCVLYRSIDVRFCCTKGRSGCLQNVNMIQGLWRRLSKLWMKYRLVAVTVIRVKLFQFVRRYISGLFFNAKLLWIPSKSGWNLSFCCLFNADCIWICHQENNSLLPFVYIFLECRVVRSLYWIFSFYIPSAGLICQTTINFCQTCGEVNMCTNCFSVLSALLILSFLF